MALSLEEKLQMQELELTALFETIRAINENASENDLYKIYKFILRSNTNYSKLCLYVKEEENWQCKSYFGTESFYDEIPLNRSLLEITEMGDLDDAETLKPFNEFDKIIPVKHKSIVLAYVLLAISDGVDNAEKLDLAFINALSNIIIVAVENKKFARKEQKQIEYNRQLTIAKNVQNLLFPKTLPSEKSLTVKASYLPHHTIGGDYYDYLELEDSLKLLCIADVSGKGIPAAILMSNFQGGLRTLVKRDRDLEKIVLDLNELIIRNAQGENFITAFFLLYNEKEHTLEYVNAGHNPPFLFRNRKSERLDKGTTVLGSFPQLPFIETGKVEDLNEFLFFSFTDGFTETYNEKGEEFGENDLEEFISQNMMLKPEIMHAKLIALLNTFKGRNAYADDITLLSLHVQ